MTNCSPSSGIFMNFFYMSYQLILKPKTFDTCFTFMKCHWHEVVSHDCPDFYINKNSFHILSKNIFVENFNMCIQSSLVNKLFVTRITFKGFLGFKNFFDMALSKVDYVQNIFHKIHTSRL